MQLHCIQMISSLWNIVYSYVLLSRRSLLCLLQKQLFALLLQGLLLLLFISAQSLLTCAQYSLSLVRFLGK